jgi:predicted RNA-binding Zn ribbon-like protein
MSDEKIRRRAARFELTADNLCLDFANTLDDRPSAKPRELLERYLDLVRFAEDAGILEAQQVDRLFEFSETAPERAQKVLVSAITLREAIHDVFWRIVKRQKVPAAALAMLNGFIQQAAQHANLTQHNGSFVWTFEDFGDPSAMLWPIARSAAELLASEQISLVGACSSKSCQWLFLDTSKNHGRRWCDMKLCGNRNKARRFHERKRG